MIKWRHQPQKMAKYILLQQKLLDFHGTMTGVGDIDNTEWPFNLVAKIVLRN